MIDIYLVGGTTARTDLDNYVSANISEENAIASMRRWQDYQGSYEDYHIDHIEIDDIEEHDAQIKSELLDKVAERINNLKYDTCDGVTRRIEHQLKAEVFKVINELKAEVNQ